VPPTIIGVVGADTVNVTTGASDTVIEEVPVFPSLVAVIVAVPAPAVVTKPVALTVAAAVLPEVQVTSRPVRTFPLTSLVTAVSCCVGLIPTTRLAVGGLTVTVATGTGLTVIVGVVAPGALSLVAEIVAVPKPTAATVIVAPPGVLTDVAALTVSTPVLLETQFTVRPDRVLPPASLGCAVNTCVPPTIIGVAATERTSVATGVGLTVSVALPVLPSLMAVTWTVPALTAVTTPPLDTVAIAAFPVLHVMVRPVRIVPTASRVIAVA
jgi:hypothetical protein